MVKRIVFVVHNDTVIADSLVAILSRNGIEATGFYMPADALEKARTTVPDLLISGVAMSDMTGTEVAIQMKSQHPQCKILLFSSAGSDLGIVQMRENSKT